ncbi:MAG: biotin transporter BioY [Clostridia bacterium]|nr:biotin transporter BioY [Clostridia bacterium]
MTEDGRTRLRKTIRHMVKIAICAALISILAPLSFPIGPIPITLATLGIYLTCLLLDPVEAVLAVSVYLALGIVGVPVFSGFTGGFGRIIGVTGGFIIGYLPCASLASFLSKLGRDKMLSWLWDALALISGTVLLYAAGTVWFTFMTDNTFLSSLTLCVLPFLPGDGIKIIFATALAAALRPALQKAGVS